MSLVHIFTTDRPPGFTVSIYDKDGTVGENRWFTTIEKAEAYAAARRQPKQQGHYGPMCMNPTLCAGKGYCPRNPSCCE